MPQMTNAQVALMAAVESSSEGNYPENILNRAGKFFDWLERNTDE